MPRASCCSARRWSRHAAAVGDDIFRKQRPQRIHVAASGCGEEGGSDSEAMLLRDRKSREARLCSFRKRSTAQASPRRRPGRNRVGSMSPHWRRHMLVEGGRERDQATIEKHELSQCLHHGVGRLPRNGGSRAGERKLCCGPAIRAASRRTLFLHQRRPALRSFCSA